MASVDIGASTYDSYADIDYADEYLSADAARATAWVALTSDAKGRALVSATRLLLRLDWKDGAPSLDTPPDAVKQATSLLAADIAARPALSDTGSASSNVKSVGAGSARVEFFSPTKPVLLPPVVLALLREWLGAYADDPALVGTAYGSCAVSRFDPSDYGLTDYGADWRAREPWL